MPKHAVWHYYGINLNILTCVFIYFYLFICNLFGAAIADILSLYIERVWRRLCKICWTLCDVCLLQPSLRKMALLSKVIHTDRFFIIYFEVSFNVWNRCRDLSLTSLLHQTIGHVSTWQLSTSQQACRESCRTRPAVVEWWLVLIHVDSSILFVDFWWPAVFPSLYLEDWGKPQKISQQSVFGTVHLTAHEVTVF
jgi:hypothetical protein